jgi:hypothetical protein
MPSPALAVIMTTIGCQAAAMSERDLRHRSRNQD